MTVVSLLLVFTVFCSKSFTVVKITSLVVYRSDNEKTLHLQNQAFA